jgi:Gly-Xaa carboxypeptidase
LDQGSDRKIELSDAWGTALEPAPVSPIDALPFKILSGTIRAVGVARRNSSDTANEDRDDDKQVFVAPSVMTGESRQ